MKLEICDLQYIGNNRLYYTREKHMSMAYNYPSITDMHRVLYDGMSSKWQVEVWVISRVGSPWYLYKKIE